MEESFVPNLLPRRRAKPCLLSFALQNSRLLFSCAPNSLPPNAGKPSAVSDGTFPSYANVSETSDGMFLNCAKEFQPVYASMQVCAKKFQAVDSSAQVCANEFQAVYAFRRLPLANFRQLMRPRQLLRTNFSQFMHSRQLFIISPWKYKNAIAISSSRFHSKNEFSFAYNSPAACFSSSLKFAFSSSASVSSEESVCESAV